MKTLLVSFLIAVSSLSGQFLIPQQDANLPELNLDGENILQNVVKIFDYRGNLIKEMNVSDVNQDEISISDYLILESSHFAFSYLGDYYYLRD